MTIRALVFIATSLDGFIAREDGSLDWLPAPSSEEDYGYTEFMARVDVLVMGRKTYETALGFGEWPYSGKRVVVLSSTLAAGDIPSSLHGKVEIDAGPLPELVQRLEAEGHKGIYVDGGKTIQSFLNAGLIDEIIITRIPILLGSGIPLFDDLAHDIHLQHLGTKNYASGFVQNHYRVI
ncbi:MAG: dihydrofolate reductase family protein, partial [Gallionella sp.]